MQKKMRDWLSIIAYIIIVCFVVHLVTEYVGQRTTVTGDSMLETLQEGDNLIIDKVSYRFSEPERFDIVIFPYEHSKDIFYIKRIIGMPGEVVQIRDGYVYIDDVRLENDYGTEIHSTKYGIAEEPIMLGPDEYFVLGDNRNNSADSREPSVGLVSRDEIVGKAEIRIWPLDRFGIISRKN